jgi:uncharacterized protein YdeI (YjbR/CyaY-like superfamily)
MTKQEVSEKLSRSFATAHAWRAWRLHTAMKPEIRVKRMEPLLAMVKKGKKPHDSH